jgi:hypothetical protein
MSERQRERERERGRVIIISGRKIPTIEMQNRAAEEKGKGELWRGAILTKATMRN